MKYRWGLSGTRQCRSGGLRAWAALVKNGEVHEG